MFKYLVFLAMLAVAFAAPQFLLAGHHAGVLDNEGAKQIGLPYANGWTDGPNNGVGPVVAVAHAPVVAHTPYYAGVAGAHYVY